MPTGGTCPIGGGRGAIKWEGPVGGVFAAVMLGGGAIPGGGVWFEVCEAEFVEGEVVRYSRSSSSSVTAFKPGGKDGEPLACEAWKNSSRYHPPVQYTMSRLLCSVHVHVWRQECIRESTQVQTVVWQLCFD